MVTVRRHEEVSKIFVAPRMMVQFQVAVRWLEEDLSTHFFVFVRVDFFVIINLYEFLLIMKVWRCWKMVQFGNRNLHALLQMLHTSEKCVNQKLQWPKIMELFQNGHDSGVGKWYIKLLAISVCKFPKRKTCCFANCLCVLVVYCEYPNTFKV